MWLNLKDIIYFSRISTWVLQRKEVTLRKSSLLCKSSSKSAPKCRVFDFQMIKLSRLVDLQRMSTSHFFIHDSATFKLSLTEINWHLPEIVHIIAGSWMFLITFMSFLLIVYDTSVRKLNDNIMFKLGLGCLEYFTKSRRSFAES